MNFIPENKIEYFMCLNSFNIFEAKITGLIYLIFVYLHQFLMLILQEAKHSTIDIILGNDIDHDS